MRTHGRARQPIEYSAPFDLLRFPPSSDEQFIGDDGAIRVGRADVEQIRW